MQLGEDYGHSSSSYAMKFGRKESPSFLLLMKIKGEAANSSLLEI